VDLSALIFVALAVAWAVYLIPKALKHHEDDAASRNVDGFSDRMRVLARREPVDRKTARLVVQPGRTVSAPVEPPAEARMPALLADQLARSRRLAAATAAKRRLRVVCTILFVGVAVGVLAGLGYIAATYASVPAAALVVWLAACRLMVKKERAASVPTRRLPVITDEAVPDGGPLTEEIAAVTDEPVAESPSPPTSGGWDPMPVTLPTYVDKAPAARRTVRTIDLDSTGVWSSGFSAADSALAREAEEADQQQRATRSASRSEAERRASGT